MDVRQIDSEIFGGDAMAKENARVAQLLSGRRRRVLLVGSGGYVGAPLTLHLLRNGWDVRGSDLLLYGTAGAITPFLGCPGYEFMKGDFAERETRQRLLEGVSDVVILGGLVGDPITAKYPTEHELINDQGILKLLDDIIGLPSGRINKLIFISTCSNYGEIPGDAIADENYELKPLSLYAKAKVAAEQHLLGTNSGDISPTVLRFATAFGLSVRMRFDLTVSQFTRTAFIGNELDVYDADTWRPYCHVQDFAELITRVLAAPEDIVRNEVFNAGGEANNFTKRMITEAIREKLPHAKISFTEGDTDRRNYRVDFSKVRNALGFEPRFTVKHGIDELCDALAAGFYSDYDANPNFYGNYNLSYPAD